MALVGGARWWRPASSAGCLNGVPAASGRRGAALAPRAAFRGGVLFGTTGGAALAGAAHRAARAVRRQGTGGAGAVSARRGHAVRVRARVKAA